jgi:hypothetical protein
MPFFEKDLKIGSILVYDDKKLYSIRIILQKLSKSFDKQFIHCVVYDFTSYPNFTFIKNRIYMTHFNLNQWSIL